MKFLLDYFPIICFFIAYKIYGFYVATAVLMGACFLQVLYFWLRHRRFEKVYTFVFLIVLVLGAMTLFFHNTLFIKWKVSVVYWFFAILLFGSQIIGKDPFIKRIFKMGGEIDMPDKIWARLNIAWGIFFTCMGFLNVYVMYHYSTNDWVNFKLFGTLALTFLFIVLQAIYMVRFIKKSD